MRLPPSFRRKILQPRFLDFVFRAAVATAAPAGGDFFRVERKKATTKARVVATAARYERESPRKKKLSRGDKGVN